MIPINLLVIHYWLCSVVRLISVLLNSINILRKYWTCFQYQKLDEPSKAVSLAVSDSR